MRDAGCRQLVLLHLDVLCASAGPDLAYGSAESDSYKVLGRLQLLFLPAGLDQNQQVHIQGQLLLSSLHICIVCSNVHHHLCFCSDGLDTSSRPCLLSVDCEMCQTATNVRELIGLSIVNEAGSTVLKVKLQLTCIKSPLV